MPGRAYPAVRTRQRGQAAIIVLLLIIGVGVTILIYNFPNPAKLSIERARKTAEALAQAKAALIGFAAGIDLGVGASRPGDLPCPDRDDDGDADAVPICSGGALGRLPWKTLGLPDLRDGDGERLWYAVSSNFKNNPRTDCVLPGQAGYTAGAEAGCLNSDSRGTITVRNSGGAVIHDGSNPNVYSPSGVIAVILAPGAVLQRQGAGAPQDRSCTVGIDCDAVQRCTASPPSATPKCNPVNYLDVFTGAFGTEDNANFSDGSNADGFIRGDIFNASGNLIVNDRMITITYADLMPLLERRVAKEAFNCLTAYAAAPQNNRRYPWAAPITDVTSPYADQADVRFGRLPDTFNNTLLGINGTVTALLCAATPGLCMTSSWPPSCNITLPSNWWYNWKELVFYGVAEAYQPSDSLLGVPAGGPCGSCLRIDPPTSDSDKRFVVLVAGKRLSVVAGGQPRTPGNKDGPENYVEDDNVNGPGADSYTQRPTSTIFNDFLLFQ